MLASASHGAGPQGIGVCNGGRFNRLPMSGPRCYAVPMKKGHGLKRALPALSREQLEALPTGALLARLKRPRWCEESPEVPAGREHVSDKP